MKKIYCILILSLLFSVIPSFRGKAAAQAPETDRADYSITRITGDPDWAGIPVMEIGNVLWTDDYGIRARGQLCYNEDALFVHLRAVEKDIRAENTEPLSPVYEDSCLEFFFKLPDSDNYFNFEINPNGCLCMQFGPGRADRINIVRSDAAEYFNIHTGRTSDGWEVFYRIPLKFIRLFCPEYRFEGELEANLYKCGDKTANRHYLSWKSIDLESPDFHCPEYFGRMKFEDPIPEKGSFRIKGSAR